MSILLASEPRFVVLFPWRRHSRCISMRVERITSCVLCSSSVTVLHRPPLWFFFVRPDVALAVRSPPPRTSSFSLLWLLISRGRRSSSLTVTEPMDQLFAGVRPRVLLFPLALFSWEPTNIFSGVFSEIKLFEPFRPQTVHR